MADGQMDRRETLRGASMTIRNPKSEIYNSQSLIRNWRLVRHGPAEGAANMAVDEAIARAVAEGLVPPTLRFYAWEPPCISLGRHQPLAAVNVKRCAEHGYDIVRRPTGGRAILHTDELTYSVAARQDDPLMSGMVMDVYLRLSEGLLEGLRRLGVEAEPAPGTNRAGPHVSAACFEVPSAYEILAGGRKLLGSAQNRRSGFVLQHGSLPLTGDLDRLIDCLVLPSAAEQEKLRRSLTEHATTLEAAAGRPIGFDEAVDALANGFESTLGIELLPSNLTVTEQAWALDLARDKYGHPDWTERT
jgi:lipoyl(octanoyl) transferase